MRLREQGIVKGRSPLTLANCLAPDRARPVDSNKQSDVEERCGRTIVNKSSEESNSRSEATRSDAKRRSVIWRSQVTEVGDAILITFSRNVMFLVKIWDSWMESGCVARVMKSHGVRLTESSRDASWWWSRTECG